MAKHFFSVAETEFGEGGIRAPESTSVVGHLAIPDKSRSRPITLPVVCAVALITAIAAGTLILLFHFRDRALADGERELTNTALIDCLPTLRQFKNLGIAIALDDFGTGYSSLSQLTMFPFDKIKIDKSFTQNLTNRAECAAIISATLTLAQSLDIATTAEGVETVQQYQLLRLAGVTSLQGHLFKCPGLATNIDFDGVYNVPGLEDAA
jgi:predicted signal transduction protein with EAL and GGDEF domain